MATRNRHVMSTPAKWIAGVLIGALVIVTVVLAFFAVERNSTPPSDETPDPVPSFTLGTRTTPTPTASQTAPAAAGAGAPGADARFLSVGSDVIWRATAGECGTTAPVIERSTDAGETWTDVTPAYRGIGEVLSLDAIAQVQAETIARVGSGCETQALRTFTQGQFWEPYADVLSASRYLDPADGASVVTPAGEVTTPCAEPWSFRASGEVVALVCDGVAHRLVDGTWSALPATDVVALAISGATVLTASEADGCAGVALTRWSGADLADQASLGCVLGADPSAPLAVAGTADAALVWSGDALLTPTL